jgi:hypothetical protein
MCRSAVPPEPLEPGFTLDYACELCAKPLQVSRTGVKQIRELRSVPLCNRCGGELLKQMGSGGIGGEIRLSPHATAQIERMTGESILDTFPNAATEILEEE